LSSIIRKCINFKYPHITIRQRTFYRIAAYLYPLDHPLCFPTNKNYENARTILSKCSYEEKEITEIINILTDKSCNIVRWAYEIQMSKQHLPLGVLKEISIGYNVPVFIVGGDLPNDYAELKTMKSTTEVTFLNYLIDLYQFISNPPDIKYINDNFKDLKYTIVGIKCHIMAISQGIIDSKYNQNDNGYTF